MTDFFYNLYQKLFFISLIVSGASRELRLFKYYTVLSLKIINGNISVRSHLVLNPNIPVKKKSLLNLSVLQSSIFLALPSIFFDKKGKYLLYTFDTFLEVAAPAKLPYSKKINKT